MPRKSLVLSFLFAIATFALLAAAVPRRDNPSGPAAGQAGHLQRGRASFELGFYEHLPKNKRAEAEAAFTAAVRELDLAIQDDPNNREARRLLARIHALRRDHVEAAEQYRRLTEIDPFDIDAYALAALELAQAGRFTEARIELEKAKGRTADARVLALLDEYLGKLSGAEKHGADGR